MYRISSSLIISLFLHVALLFLLFLSWRVVTSFDKKEKFFLIKVHNMILPKEIQQAQEELPPKKRQEHQKTISKQHLVKKINNTPKEQIIKVQKVVSKTQSAQKKELNTPLPSEIHQEVIPTIVNKQQKESPVVEEDIQVTTQKRYIQNNLDKIVTLITENLYYPRSARKKGIESEEIVEFTLMPDATVSNIRVENCQIEILCKAAIETINSLSGEFPKPDEKLLLHVPINYTLRR